MSERSLAVVLLLLLASSPGIAQVDSGKIDPNTFTYGASLPNSTARVDGPDLMGKRFDPHDDEETWDQRFVVDKVWGQALSDRPVTGPVTTGDRIVIAFVGRKLQAYDSDEGSTLWTTDMPGDVVGSLLVGPNGDIFLVTLQGDALRIRAADGQPVFRAHLAQEIRTSPVLEGSTLLVSSRNDLVYALDAATGKVRWSASTKGTGLTAPAVSPAVSLVAVGDEEGRVHALSFEGGNIEWQQELGFSIKTSPAVDERSVYVVTGDRYLYALSSSSGRKRWRHLLGAATECAPVIAETEHHDLLLLATHDNILHGIDAANGFRRWKARLPRRVVAPLRIVGDVVYATPFSSNKVMAFMIKNGYPLGNLELSNSRDYAVGAAWASDRRILVASYGRNLSMWKRITSRQVEDGDEKLPERFRTEGSATPGFVPSTTGTPGPGSGAPGTTQDQYDQKKALNPGK